MTISTIDRAGEEIQSAILRMVEEGQTYTKIADWLSDNGVPATRATVGYHLRQNGVHRDRQWWTDPADTFAGRMEQYTAALKSCGTNPFRLFDLNLRGRAWGACTSKLLTEGVIEKVPGRRKWYRVVVVEYEGE